ETFEATSRDPRVLQFLLQVQKPFHEERMALKAEVDQFRLQADTFCGELEAVRQQVDMLGQERDRLVADRAEVEERCRESERRDGERQTELAAAQARIITEQ